MKKTQIHSKQIASLILLFLFGDVFIRIGHEVGSKKIYTILIAAAAAFFVFFIISRLIGRYPGMNFTQISEKLFGKTISKILSSLYVLYFFSISSLIVISCVFYLNIIDLPYTPRIMITLCVCAWFTFSLFTGIPALGRFCLMSVGIVVLLFLATTIFGLFRADFSFLLPLSKFNLNEIFGSGYAEFAFDFGDIIAILFLSSHFKITKKPSTPFYIALSSYVFILLLIQIRNITVLGDKLSQNLLYPITTAVSVVNVSDVIQRIESFIAFAFCLSTLVRVSVYLFAIMISINYVIGKTSKVVLPIMIGSVLFVISTIAFSTPADIINWMDSKYIFYAIPFQIIIPIIIWIISEIKKNKTLQKNMLQG